MRSYSVSRAILRSRNAIAIVLIAMAGATFVAGCGGGKGSGSSSVLPQVQGRNRAVQSVFASSANNVAFSIGVTPKAGIWPSTQSLQVLTDGANPIAVNTTKASTDCVVNPKLSGSFLCTGSATIAPGSHVFTFTAYSAAAARGTVLSTTYSNPFTVPTTGTSTVPITLGGPVNYVTLSLTPTNPPIGTRATIFTRAVLQDVNQAFIVGASPYTYPVTLTTSDATDGPLSKTLLKSPADDSGISVNYDGANVRSITYSASAIGLPTANVVGALLIPVIDSASATINAASGGTIKLRTGSILTVGPGTFSTNEVVTVELRGAPSAQPPNQTISNATPALHVSYSPVAANVSTAVGVAQPDSGTEPGIVATLLPPAPTQVSSKQIAVANAMDTSGTNNFFALPFTVNATSTAATVSFKQILKIATTDANAFDLSMYLPTYIPPKTGPLQFVNGKWQPYVPGTITATQRILALTHGIRSSVETTYADSDNNSCVGAIQSAGKYDAVVGFDYDWTQPESNTAPLYAKFLNQLPAYWIDVEAHSFGTINTLGALEQPSVHPTAPPKNVVLLAGPLAGTPMAQGSLIETVLLNSTASPPPTMSQLQEFQASGAQADLIPGSNLLKSVVGGFNLSNEDINVIKVAGDHSYGFGIEYLLQLLLANFGLTPGTYDGVIPVASAIAPPVGFSQVFPDNHSQVPCDPNVISYVAQHLVTPAPSPGPKIYVGNTGNSNAGVNAKVTTYNADGTSTTPTITLSDLDYPDGIAVDASGKIYVANLSGYRVATFTAAGAATTPMIPEIGVANSVYSMALDGAGNIHVADLLDYHDTNTANAQYGDIATYTANGTLSSPTFNLAELTSGPCAIVNSPHSAKPTCYDPSSIAVDSSGKIYVLSGYTPPPPPATQYYFILTTYMANGTPTSPTIPLAAKPTALAVDAAGKIYVANYNNAVTTYTPSGTQTTLTITTGLNEPYGIAVDAAGKIYVTNKGNNTVTVYKTDGTLTNPMITGLYSPVGIAVR
jgi:hypothetical protein